MNVKELRAICKHLKIRGYSRWSKAEMESAIYIKSVFNWYNPKAKDKAFIAQLIESGMTFDETRDLVGQQSSNLFDDYDDIMPNCSIEIKNEDLEDAELNIQHL
tara:strand:- start:395 stop:706 length:312 start_codon:yes stop_codon:yes gene_type:complete